MTPLEKLVDELERSYNEALERQADPAVYNDHREAAAVGRRLKELEGPYKLAQAWRQARADVSAARGDAELTEMVPDYEAEVARLEEELKLSLVERDPADEKDVIVEVRQGVGGDEAGLWAADVARMLQRYAERRGFKWEELEVSPNDGGGMKEGTFAVKGDRAASAGGKRRARREDPHVQLSAGQGDGPSRRRQRAARGRARRRPRAVHGGIDGRRTAPRARAVTIGEVLRAAADYLERKGV